MPKVENKYLILLGLHVVIGVGIYFFKSLSVFYFLLIVFLSVYYILKSSTKNKTTMVLFGGAYMVGAEVFLRMTGGNLAYEASKYVVILLLFLGMFSSGKLDRKSYTYFIYLFLLIPGIVVASKTLNFDTNMRKAVAFNLSGPICLGISALYCYNRSISFKDFQKVIIAFILPLVSTLIYLFLYTPNLREVLTSTGSNYDTSGGFGPNQVATMLGFGIFLLVVRFFINSKNIFYKALHLFLIAFMTYRALITFSRGGVYVAAIIIAAFIWTYYVYTSKKFRVKIISLVVLFGLVLTFTWVASSLNTFGLLEKRYANQDAIGNEKEDITTGRKELLASELNEFFENPFFGVGVGKIKEIRFEKEGVIAASHNEMSRILAEHGIMGVIAFLILVITPLVYRLRNKRNIFFYSFYIFWLLTINHSAMRIAAPAFIYGLSLLNFTYEKPPVHRKPIIAKR